MTFKKWLKAQIKTKSLRGAELDFAEDAVADKTFTEPTTLERLIGMLMNKRACREALGAAESCYHQWQEQDPKAWMDGFSPRDKERVRKALRQVWGWSYPRRLVVQRCTDKEGFAHCEKCRERVPRIYVDHIQPVGKVDRGMMERLFVPSAKLQGLCKSCHGIKTRKDNKATRGVKSDTRKKSRRKPFNFTDEF